MTITPEELDSWCQKSPEDQRLEFKEAKNQYSIQKLKEYCVAIANEGGGFFILGITDPLPRLVKGTNAFQNIPKIHQKLYNSLGFRVDVDVVAHPKGRVVVFHIPSRPKGSAYHLDGKYLMRSGASLVPMSEDQLRRILTESAPDWLEEFSRTGLTAQQIIELLDTQTFFELIGEPYPEDRLSVITSLTGHQLIDEQEGTYAIRRISALLLARNLNEFPDVKRKAPRVVVYEGSSNDLPPGIGPPGLRKKHYVTQLGPRIPLLLNRSCVHGVRRQPHRPAYDGEGQQSINDGNR